MKQLVIPKNLSSLMLLSIFVDLGKLGHTTPKRGNPFVYPLTKALANAGAYEVQFSNYTLPEFAESEIGKECGFFVVKREIQHTFGVPYLLREAIPWLNCILKEAGLFEGFEIVLE